MSGLKFYQSEDLIEVFEDTRSWYSEDPELQKAVADSIAGTHLYPEGAAPAPGPARFPEGTTVTVSRRRTLEAALERLSGDPKVRVAVLNFASATHPGGGVTRGSRAQEEALCRCSTLYPALCTQTLRREFYDFHYGRHDTRYTDACIYTPGVTVIKTDTSVPQRLDRREWQKVDVLTCAAPNLRKNPYNAMNPGSGTPLKLSDGELLALHVKRGRQILRVAAHHGADTVILGAFGCGAFRNPPNVVAKAYRELMNEFDGQFKAVEFAVYCSSRDTGNYDAFARAMS